ncbi:hypothetical protein BH11MYX1_BH11MYX1_43140 [soil metagenome]
MSGAIFIMGPTFTVTVPPTVEAGDLLLLAVFCNQQTAMLSVPSDWQIRFDAVDSLSQFRASYASRRVRTGDPDHYDLAVTGSDRVAWGLAAYRGVLHVDVDLADLAMATPQPDRVVYTVPSLTTSRPGDEIVLLMINDYGYDDTVVWTAPTGMVTQLENMRLGAFAAAQPACATGERTASTTCRTRNWRAAPTGSSHSRRKMKQMRARGDQRLLTAGCDASTISMPPSLDQHKLAWDKATRTLH